MTLTCTSRYAGHGAQCQEQDHRHTVHHAHDDTGSQCLQWVDPGDSETRIPAVCDWRKIHDAVFHDAVFHGAGPAAEIKARRARLTAVAVEHPDNELLRAEIERLRYEENRATPVPGPCPIPGCGWDAEGTLDEHLYEHDYNELRPAVARLALENDQLRTELAKSRRDALFTASEIAGTVDTETSAQKATQATIVAKLRVAALADDKCAKCQHRRGDHHYGGICKVRRSAARHCACRQYGFPTTAPKED